MFSESTPIPSKLGPDGGPLMLPWEAYERSTLSEIGSIMGANSGPALTARYANPVTGTQHREELGNTVFRAKAARRGNIDEVAIKLPRGTVCMSCKTVQDTERHVVFTVIPPRPPKWKSPSLTIQFCCNHQRLGAGHTQSITNPQTRAEMWAASTALTADQVSKTEEAIVAKAASVVEQYKATAGEDAKGWDPWRGRGRRKRAKAKVAS